MGSSKVFLLASVTAFLASISYVVNNGIGFMEMPAVLSVLSFFGLLGEDLKYTLEEEELLVREVIDQPSARWYEEFDWNAEGPLTSSQMQQFREDGFLVVEDFFTMDIISDLRKDVSRRLDDLATKLYNSGIISSKFEDLDYTERLVAITEEYEDAAVVFTMQGWLPESFRRLHEHPKLLELCQQLGMGDSIAAHPAWNLRSKIPRHKETEVPFHQDNSYWHPTTWDRLIVSVWIPLVEATVENGALEFVRTGHKSGRTGRHTCCFSNTWYTEISERDIKGLLPEGSDLEELKTVLPMKPGSLVFFPGTIPHRSLPNLSKGVRWSIDLRFHGVKDEKQDLDMFYGVKDSLIIKKKDPNFRADWDEWAGQERTQLQDRAMSYSASELNAIVVGPWMDLWDINRLNRHTEAYLALQKEKEEL